MDDLSAVERVLATLSTTPAGILLLIVALVLALSPMAIMWLNRRNRGDNKIATGLIDVMTDVMQDIKATMRDITEAMQSINSSVELSRQAIERSNAITQTATAAMEHAETSAKERQTAIMTRLDSTAEAQTVIFSRFDVLENMVTDTMQKFVQEITEHDKRAGDRTSKLITEMESQFGALLNEVRMMRDEPREIRTSGD